jgi:nucleoside-diphosphate-sugar epimerase
MILVTGGTGLVGSHLILHLLENGEQSIFAIYKSKSSINKTKALFTNKNKSELFSRINWIKANILDIPSLELAFKNIDFVYHCAAKISFDPNDETSLRKVNIEGTANIVNFCIAKKIKKLCYVSSIAALGELAQNELEITEESEWNPEIIHSDYAISKFGAEMEVWRGQQEGLDCVIVNPGIILGSGFFNDGSGKLFYSVKKGMYFYTNGVSGYVAVEDVVKIMVLLMNSDIKNERFIVIAENKTYKDVIFSIAENLNVSKPKIEAKPWLLKLAWSIDYFMNLFFRTKRKISKNAIHALINTAHYSNKKIKNVLNYEFISVDNCIATISKVYLNL